MKRIIYILLILCLLFGLTGIVGGCTKTGSLKLTLNDLYYEEFYLWGKTSYILVAELTLENTGKEEITIGKSYLQDAEGTDYLAFLLYENWTKTQCLACSKRDIVYKNIEHIQPGEKTVGYFMLAKDLPKDATGLKLIIETGTGQATLSLPDASSIRVISIPGFE